MKVLVVNCGSSSLKYQLIDSETEQALAVGLCERIGIDGRLKHTPAGGDKVVLGERYAREHLPRLVHLVVKAEILQAGLDGAY